MSITKSVYYFGDGKADGDGSMKELLGGKGANLAEMCRLGIPVPAGFTITTEVCTYYYKNKRQQPSDLKAAVNAALTKVERTMGRLFGDPTNPAPPLCPLRRPRLDAGHDGNRPQRRPHLQDDPRTHRQDARTSASSTTPTAA
jgi:hypothetical protein